MCRPTCFDVTYDINPWMSGQIGQVDKALAVQQWDTLVESLSRHSVINLVDGAANVPDLVFTANAGFIHKNIAILSKFANKERQPEEAIFKKWFESKEYNVIQPTLNYEGEGDHLVDTEGRHWIGSGFRTDAKVAGELTDIIGTPVTALELVDPRWYHLDTCFCPLPNGEIMWYPGAFSTSSQDLINRSFRRYIDVYEEEALQFCCNCVCIGNDLFLPKTEDAATELIMKNYDIHEFDLSEFLKAGGAAKCLVLELE